MPKSEEYYCPNPFCKKEVLTEEEKECPECGAWSQRIEEKEIAKLLQQKRRGAVGQSARSLLFSDEMTDEEIRALVSKGMLDLTMQEAGTGWMHLSTTQSLSSTDQIIGSGLKALIDQNKIIIRQNELLFRELKKLAEKDESRRKNGP